MRLIDDATLNTLAKYGEWKLDIYDFLESRVDHTVEPTQGYFDLGEWIAWLSADTEHRKVSLETERLGFVAGHGGSGWKPCSPDDLSYLQRAFELLYGQVAKINEYR